MAYERPAKGGVAFGFAMCCFMSLFFASWGITRIVLYYQYDIACGGHLKRAADANTIELAKTELSTAIAYMDEQKWNKGGSTHIFFATPNCDVGFWYKNLVSARDELNSLSPETSQLEKTNVLMKLRETILDDGGDDGVTVTGPPAIYIYPDQQLFCIWGWLSFLIMAPAWFLFLVVVSPR